MDAPAPDARIQVSALSGRALDSLSVGEARALCIEELRRIDSCLEAALRTTSSVSDCRARAIRCRENAPEGATLCENAAPIENCPRTVADYLACLDDWNAALSCDLAGNYLFAPERCATLAEDCRNLSLSFSIEGALQPCTEKEKASKPLDDNDDIHGHDGCRPGPDRFVVLGDSIADCTGTSTACAPRLIADFLRDEGFPDLTFETHATAGARVDDLITQAMQVNGGRGHVFVWVYAIGNDFIAANFNVDRLKAGYERMFGYFTDAERFPDGATFLLNTQYHPWDECNIPGSEGDGSPELDALFRDVNQRVFLDVAVARDDTVAVDQLPDFLGHGLNADRSGCPHCGPDNESWMADSIHANDLGHMHFAEKWQLALTKMVGPECRRDAGL